LIIGTSVAQRGIANGQRGWNRQPGGGASARLECRE
jgi:hypothetical protein